MPRYKRFTFLCSHRERRMLAALSKYLNRSQSDTVRQLIREADRNLLTQTDLSQARAQWLTELRLKLIQLLPMVVKVAADTAHIGQAEPYIALAVYVILAMMLFWPSIR